MNATENLTCRAYFLQALQRRLWRYQGLVMVVVVVTRFTS